MKKTMWCSRCVQALHRQSIGTPSQRFRLSRNCDRACLSYRKFNVSKNVLYERRHGETQDSNVRDIHSLPPTHSSHSSSIERPPFQNSQLAEKNRLKTLRDEHEEQNHLRSKYSGLTSAQHQHIEDVEDNQEDTLDDVGLTETVRTRDDIDEHVENDQLEASEDETVESYDEYSINPETIVSEGSIAENVATEEVNQSESTMPVTESDEPSTATVVRPQSTEESIQPSVYPLNVSQDTVISMVQMLRDLRKQGLPNELDTLADADRELMPEEKVSSKWLRVTNPKDRELAYQKQQSDPKYLNMLTDRSKLPINQESVKRKILSLLEENDVLVLVSETGSGKSTQLPQLILEHEFKNARGHKCNILCTQPRRIAATSVAKRVADEQGVSLGPYSHVGYSIRFRNLPPDMGGSIAYWTAGVLLKDLHESPFDIFSTYSTIIIDEVHERDLVTDLCLTMLRDLIWANKLAKRPYPKVVLMSATLDAIRFKNYFEEQHNGNILEVASLDVPGRNYAVESHMLDDIIYDITTEPISDRRANSMLRGNEQLLNEEDEFTKHWESLKEMEMKKNESTDLICSARDRLKELNSEPGAKKIGSAEEHVPLSLLALTIAHLLHSTDSGDILVFLPGMFEIGATLTTLQNQDLLGIDFNNPDKVKIFRLHSSLYETNDEVFQPLSVGCRRVILATNIAQTSITLPDVTYVVDCGKHREMSFQPELGYSVFKTVWADQSTCAQRRGRAGRTRPGHYWALYTQSRYESLPKSITPGIKLADLATAALTVSNHVRNMSPRPFLQRMLDSPDPAAVDNAIQQLQKLQMLTSDEKITSLGRFAVSLPLPPAVSRSLLLSTLFRCLEPLLVIACHNPDKPLIYSPKSSYNAMVSNATFSDHQDDDRFTFIKAFQQYDAAVRANNRAEIRDLHGRSVTASPHREMVNVGHQVYSTLASYGVVPSGARTAYDVDKSVFPDIPAAFNQNSNDDNLVKAVALTTMHTNMAVWDSSAKHWITGRTKFFLRPYSMNSKTGLKALGRHDHQRREGEIMAYTYGLKTLGNTIPMLVETSSVTPLMAILFGGPVGSVSDGVLQIDGWLRYAVKVEKDRDNPTSLSDVQAANLILETRKALDRYLSMAFSGLTRQNYLDTKTQGRKKVSYNPAFTSNPIRTTITQGITHILKLDTRHWNGSYNSFNEPAKEN